MTDQADARSRTWAVRAVLAIAGIGVFGAGIRWDSTAVRWAGIAIVGVAWVLRFAKARPDPNYWPDDTR